ncbi:DegV family protein [Cytobacillus sp. FSL W7-1323]|uniref:Fatty acid-binding protein DegV n=1 Tax=Cytobacillus kochii TaxID=859143 RepID=A0A248TME0_9BACI|nr:DegV family protein [Cytobacillus kochii]ASV69305.1 fatty acid-binding protein DegV [Cytobacillus kochii]
MTRIKIVTDSTVDLSAEMITKLDIAVVPLSININGQSYEDRVDITPQEFLDLMRQSDELPKSSQPATGTFVELYDQLNKDGYDEIISIHMTGGMSGTVDSARTAADITEANVTVIDSRFISKALAFQVIAAAELADKGEDYKRIIQRIQEIQENTKLYVVVDTLENLIKGGRIGKGKGLIGSLLNIKPIASLADGVYTPITKVRSHSQVIKFLSKQLVEDAKGKTIKSVGITHAGGLELARKLKEVISELTGFNHVTIEDTTPIISTHTGEGAIGFCYHIE